MPPDICWQRQRQGLIKAFEYCFELGWNTLRYLLLGKGNAGLIGSRARCVWLSEWV